MSIQNEKNTDFGVDTDVLRYAAKEYSNIADELTTLAENLDDLLMLLAEEGWTTRAGKTFQTMAKTNWKSNVQKYSALLETLNSILIKAADEYDEFIVDYVETTKLKI